MSTSNIYHLEDYLTSQMQEDDSDSDSEEEKPRSRELDKFYDVELQVDTELGAQYQELVKKNCQGIKRGDLIAINRKRDRNEGVLIWDGNKACHLSGYPDDYGCVPREFSVITEFPINYWLEKVCHNCYVPFCHRDYGQHILTNLELMSTAISRSQMDVGVDYESEWQLLLTYKGIDYEVPTITYVHTYRTHVEVESQKYEIYIHIRNYFKEIANEDLLRMIHEIYEHAPMETLYYHAERNFDGEELKDLLSVPEFDEKHSLCLEIDLLPQDCSMSSHASKDKGPILSDNDLDQLNHELIRWYQHKLTHHYDHIMDIGNDETLFPQLAEPN